MSPWLLHGERTVRCTGGASDRECVGEPDLAIAIEGDTILAVEPMDALAQRFPNAPVIQARLVTPGLIDAHTHLPWAGSRHEEYALRMQGAGYEAIAKAGGGIVASQKAIAAASREELAELTAQRLLRMAALGVTTVEAKSGYGLVPELERKQLEALREASRPDMPRVVPTFLGLHALPAALKGDPDQHVRTMIAAVEGIARDGLAEYADAYIDRNAFSAEQARAFFEAAHDVGLRLRAHVGQFADIGGAELIAELGGDSADHLEQLSERGAERLAKAGTAAVLLPVASFTLGQAPPPVARLRAHGVDMVVASDANPGTAPTESLPLAMALASRVYGLTVSEVLAGVTRNAARSLGLGDRVGQLAAGFKADITAWDLPHEAALVQPWGVTRASRVWRGGELIATAERATL